MTEAELRDKDQAILHAIQQGHNDTQKITSHTTLENHHVRYSLKKLSYKDLIHLEKPDGMTERTINGQKRVFQTPWQATLTDKGLEHLKKAEIDEEDRFKNQTNEELIERVKLLESEIQDLQNSFEVFRRQVQQRLK